MSAVAVLKAAVGRVNVKNTAAQGKLTGTVHKIDAHVSRIGQAFDGTCQIDRVGVGQKNLIVRKRFGWDGITESGVRSGHYNVVVAAKKPRQHAKPLMLVLMGGGNVIKGEVARHVERGADAVTLKHAAGADAILFFGEDQECRATAKADGVAEQGDEKGVCRAVAKPRRKDWQGIVTKILLQRPKKLFIFGILSDRFG